MFLSVRLVLSFSLVQVKSSNSSKWNLLFLTFENIVDAFSKPKILNPDLFYWNITYNGIQVAIGYSPRKNSLVSTLGEFSVMFIAL